MYTKIKRSIDKVKETKEVVQSSWAYNHKHVIVTLSFIAVIAVQNFSYMLPSVTLTKDVYAHNDTPKVETCDYDCLTFQWVELRAEQIHEDMLGTAKIQALQEAHNQFDTVMKQTYTPNN